MRRARVLILSSEPKTVDALAAAVRSKPSLELVAAEQDDSLGVVESAEADVVVVDSELEALGDSGALHELRRLRPEVRWVLLSAGGDEARVIEMLSVGAVACLSKSRPAPAIAQAIHDLTPDHVRLDRAVAEPLFAALSDRVSREVAADPGERGRRAVQELIDQRRYEMVFQPLVALHGSETLGLEALARFPCEPRRPPDAWLREADAVGLRCALEEALVRAALAEAGQLPPQAFLAVNLSPQAAMAGAIGRTIPASLLSRVVIELTHHHDVRDYGPLAEALLEARAGGLRIAIDDSGQSLSSLHEALRLAPDFVKLNRALVCDIDRDPLRRAVAFALHSIAAQSGASVIAEGIETPAELQALRSLGVACGQGYLIGRPQRLPAAATRIALPGGPTEESGYPPLVLPGRAMRSFRDAIRAAFSLLERELPASGLIVAHLDRPTQRYRILAASDALAETLQPGFSLPLSQSLCAHMASGYGPRLSSDAALEPAFAALDMQRLLGVTSYVGMPLELEDAPRLASLCAVSAEPDRYDHGTLEMLQALAVVLVRALEDELAELDHVSATDRLRALATTDALTGVLNRPGFLEKLDTEARGQNPRDPRKFITHLQLEGISGVREQHGRAVGELVIKDIADALTAAVRADDSIGRIDDAEFAAVLVDRDTPQQATHHRTLIGQRLREAFAKRGVTVTVRAGTAPLDGTAGQMALANARAAAAPIT